MAISWRAWARGALLICIMIITLAAPDARAAEVTVEECVEAHEQSQVLQAQGQLVEARKTLLVCSNEECPSVVRSDCANWYTRNNSDIPSLIFSVKKGENDVLDARIFVDGEPVESALDGREKEFNPGRYTVRTEMEGEEPQEKQILVSKGQRERIVQFVYEDPNAKPPPGFMVGPGGIPAEPEVPTHRPLNALTYIMAGATVLAVGAGVGLGVVGKNMRDKRLAENGGCSPYCDESETRKVETMLLAADISFGVAIAAGITTIIAFATRPRVPIKVDPEEEGEDDSDADATEEEQARTDRRLIRSSHVGFTGGPGAGGLVWRGTF